MAKIGEAYVELSARLDRLKTDLAVGRTMVSDSVAQMVQQTKVLEARQMAPGLGIMPSSFQQLSTSVDQSNESMMTSRQTIGLVAIGLGELGIRIPGLNLGFMALSRSSGPLAAAVTKVGLAIRTVTVAAGPVGIITGIAVGAAIYAWNKYQKKLDEVVAAHKKATGEMLKDFATDMQKRLSLEEAIVMARSKLTDDARTQELKADRIAADKWEKEMLDQAETEQKRNEIVLLAIGMRIAANDKFIDSIRKSNADQKKESNEAAESLEKQAKSASDKVRGLAQQMALGFWGVMGREDIVQKMRIEFNLEEQLKQLAAASQELKDVGQWTQEWAEAIERVRMGLEKTATQEIMQIEQPKFDFSVVQAGYGETTASLGRIKVSPEFTANVTGAAQENTTRSMRDGIWRLVDILSGKRGTVNVAGVYAE